MLETNLYANSEPRSVKISEPSGKLGTLIARLEDVCRDVEMSIARAQSVVKQFEGDMPVESLTTNKPLESIKKVSYLLKLEDVAERYAKLSDILNTTVSKLETL